MNRFFFYLIHPKSEGVTALPHSPVPPALDPVIAHYTEQKSVGTRRTLRYVAREFLPIRHCRAALAAWASEASAAARASGGAPPCYGVLPRQGERAAVPVAPLSRPESPMIAAVLGC